MRDKTSWTERDGIIDKGADVITGAHESQTKGGITGFGDG